MPLDRRGHYTRKHRRGRRVVTEYVGSGAAGQLAAALDAEERLAAAGRRRAVARQQADEAAREAAAAGYFARVEAVLRATLEANGYHQHARGQWRKRRGRSSHAAA